MIKMKLKKSAIALIVILFASCSSAPKRPAEVFAIQSMTDTLIGLANGAADQANYEQALTYLDNAWRLAVTTDRPALRIRVNMGRANALYSLGRTEDAEGIWRTAEREANFNDEPMLASACRVFRARSTLMSGTASPDDVLALVQKEINILKPDKLFYAMAWTVKGLSEKELGNFIEAEKSIMNALSIHEKDRYLEQAAYDWYLIASVRSVAGNYQPAIDALNRAIGFDRRAENTFGLAMDWAAIGEVYRKIGNENRAAMSWNRSAEILRAMDKEAEAQEVESRIQPGTGLGRRRAAQQTETEEE
jgi:tetratricopeptide (TPR) repeat protein